MLADPTASTGPSRETPPGLHLQPFTLAAAAMSGFTAGGGIKSPQGHNQQTASGWPPSGPAPESPQPPCPEPDHDPPANPNNPRDQSLQSLHPPTQSAIPSPARTATSCHPGSAEDGGRLGHCASGGLDDGQGAQSLIQPVHAAPRAARPASQSPSPGVDALRPPRGGPGSVQRGEEAVPAPDFAPDRGPGSGPRPPHPGGLRGPRGAWELAGPSALNLLLRCRAGHARLGPPHRGQGPGVDHPAPGIRRPPTPAEMDPDPPALRVGAAGGHIPGGTGHRPRSGLEVDP
ncbi:hypothetical protein BDW71DRAFT_193148 [Aspergillus fruticulosus]